MFTCNRGEAVQLGDGYSLLLFNNEQYHGLPSTRARGFELTGDQLQFAPDRPADVQHIKLDITLDFAQETIAGSAATTFVTLFDELRSISFDAVELQVERVALLDGPDLAFSNTGTRLIVSLDRAYKHGEQFTVVVTYHAKPRTGLHFMKPVPEDQQRPVQAWTFGQPRYHSYWFPCHDAPNDRATTEILATVPARFQTISNGVLTEVIDHGETKTHHWLHAVPHAAYLVSLVVGEFAVVEDSYHGKPVLYYVRPDRKDDAALYMGKTPEMMRFFSEITGVEYPYDNYKQTVVEIYTGAMEHTTATTHSFSLLMDKKAALDMSLDLVPVVAHELAHQWFGDLLTCRDWSNAWLNEGFATYFERMWVEHDQGNDEFKYSMLQEKSGYLAEDSVYRRPIVYYVYHNQGFELFDRHLYNKGAWVLHMLRHQLGNESFFRGIHAYLERYRTKEVVTSDFLRTLEEVTGKSLEQYFQQWVHGGGHPELEVSLNWISERKLAKVKVKQTQKIDELTACFLMPLDLAFTVPTSDEAARDALTQQTQTVNVQIQLGEEGQTEQVFYVSLEREPLMLRVDPDGWLLKTLKFERSTNALCYQLKRDSDVLGRVEAAEELGKRSEESSQDALTQALLEDTFWGVQVTAAQSLAKLGTEKAQEGLLQALQTLDPVRFSRVRSAIATALGKFQAPQQAQQAQRSAHALRALLESGDVSYLVETSAAEALGQTRTEGIVDFLLSFVSRPSWTHMVQRGIFRGLGASGEDRVVDSIAGYVTNNELPPTLRRVAIAGLAAVGQNRYLYSEQARQRAVTALTHAVTHDTWAPSRSLAASALGSFGEKRVIPLLEALAEGELDSGVQRTFLVTARSLRETAKDSEQFQTLRKDLDEVREENRRLREQLREIEARLH